MQPPSTDQPPSAAAARDVEITSHHVTDKEDHTNGPQEATAKTSKKKKNKINEPVVVSRYRLRSRK